MAELKTKVNEKSVNKFIDAIEDSKKRSDCLEIMKMMSKETRSLPKMWGDSIIGFGNYQYKYASGREGDWFIMGFSPRKQNLTLYLISGFDKYDELLKNLGKFKTSKSCLYIKGLEDVNLEILRELISQSVKAMTEKE